MNSFLDLSSIYICQCSRGKQMPIHTCIHFWEDLTQSTWLSGLTPDVGHTRQSLDRQHATYAGNPDPCHGAKTGSYHNLQICSSILNTTTGSLGFFPHTFTEIIIIEKLCRQIGNIIDKQSEKCYTTVLQKTKTFWLSPEFSRNLLSRYPEVIMCRLFQNFLPLSAKVIFLHWTIIWQIRHTFPVAMSKKMALYSFLLMQNIGIPKTMNPLTMSLYYYI